MSLGLLNLLKRKQYITDEQYESVLAAYKADVGDAPVGIDSVAPYLFNFQITSPQELAQELSNTYGYPFFDLSCYDTSYYIHGLLKEDLLYEHRVLPIFKRGNRLFLAVSDPTLEPVYRKLFFNTGYELSYVIVADNTLGEVFDAVTREVSTIFEELEKGEIFNPVRMTRDDGTSEDGPIAKFVHRIIQDAVISGASDIHFEFYEFYARIRYRMDGVLKEIVQPPLLTKEKIASRIKVMCQLDISEKRVPQDGS
ncbi:MAG: ATPase, T2SS/T4P/T4SS family, partial [Neisseriaceae bacterium]